MAFRYLLPKVLRAITLHVETTIASTLPGAHELQRDLVFITRTVLLLTALYTLVLLYYTGMWISIAPLSVRSAYDRGS
jgi:hypothetical protein